ncbi:MAG: Eco57I restriction-modification methylase domain-containing protein [gamma proteobacterium symbiont of Bathyaustriella thionipta]|nr:Eco57I restriction-modification methylase domain-containing protein [gamma proteobacterium symbiont of Bathyaustriella thionipta]
MPINSDNDLRNDIRAALQSFESRPLHDAAIGLLETLGYRSDKTIEIPGSDPRAFLQLLAEHNPDVELNKEKALFNDWLKADILFQLTDEELSDQNTLFKNDAINAGLLQSYLFFAIELKQRDYARGKLTAIARQLNRVFPMPVMVFIKHRDRLSIAVINRRLNKRDADKDVLGKVTIIRNIALANPHRGHLYILQSFALPTLVAKTNIHSFDALHAAWEDIFNVELLNERFYKELSNWYFWALENIHFPFDSIEADRDLLSSKDDIKAHDAKNLIRLLTRLLFVWFVKEKGLIPEALFDRNALHKDTLNNFDPDSRQTVFYKAILQNLFFATLNQTQGKRQFRNERQQHRNITTLLRYKKFFKHPDEFIDQLESVVPFMNGGLFECLDKPHPTRKGPQGGDVIIYEDGFSDRNDNKLHVPDFLFFGKEVSIDLSHAYGDAKRKREKVRGIIHILNSYKFTIVENTPIDQEIALDPELLGKVFENLLASYNPETKTTARKQTGSFYTPRIIVDYMVDESLKSYLGKELHSACPNVSEGDAEEGLDILFSYTEKEHAFSKVEKRALIEAIDNCKIIDPACGSGAFPMGILHKLEFILGKLDKNNKLWRNRQVEKVNDTIAMAESIDDTTIREQTIQELEGRKEDIAEAFSNNDLAYGRKLYLIENCIYGIDIKSIATQVSKLRFFISLIVDQPADSNKENFGIRPLPNLETKFVAANTLIQIDKSGFQIELIESGELKKLKNELKRVRHNIFNAKTPKTKKKYRERDKELRNKIETELISGGWDSDKAALYSQWDPYDQNASASYFEPEWMYGIRDGFNVVIGNPPYIQIQKFPKAQKDIWVAQQYQTYAATADIYCLFYERGAQLLRDGGHLSYITSNKWMRAGYGKKLRAFLSSDVNTNKVLDFGMAQNFGAATTYTCVLNFSKEPSQHKTLSCYAADDRSAMADPAGYFEANSVMQTHLDANPWVVLAKDRQRIKDLVEAQGVPLEQWDINIYRGVLTGFNDAFYITSEQRDAMIAEDPACDEIIVPLLRGRFVERYGTNWDGTWMIATFPALGYDLNTLPKPIVDHLSAYRERLEPKPRGWSGGKWNGRKAGSYRWFETQDSISYHQEFAKPKIIYPNMTKYLPFYFDENTHFFTNDKGFIITGNGDSLTYLIGILNSSLFRCCFRDNFPELMGNTYEVRKIFVDQIPIKQPTAEEGDIFDQLAPLIQFSRNRGRGDGSAYEFLENLIDACVMECYFHEHMRDRDLLFHTEVRPLLENYDPDTSEQEQKAFVEQFYKTANAPDHPIRNRLLRLTADSPDLLAVIKEHGAV